MNPARLSIVILSMVTSTLTIAAKSDNDFRLNKLNYCEITPVAENDYEPATFETTNNLLRETGQESLFCGEKIIISGVVVDQNCVPVGDAKIYIWQVDCQGKYPYLPLKARILDQDIIQQNKVLTFTGNGTATTNNKGEFHFITVYPPGVHDLSSHINIRVEHRMLGTLQTRLTLKGHKLAYPEHYPELSDINKVAAKSNIGIYNYKIVFPGESEDKY